MVRFAPSPVSGYYYSVLPRLPMKASAITLVLFLCATLGATNTIVDVYRNVMETVHNENPFLAFRNATHLFSAFPPELLANQTKEVRQMGINIIRNLTSPANIRVFMHLIKESKIRKKGEVIRLTLRFIDPINRTPEGIIRSFQTLDTTTVSELSSISLRYLKIMLPQILGHQFYNILKYIFEDDLKVLVGLYFDTFKETKTEDMLWLIERIRNEGEVAKASAREVLKADGQTLIKDWEINGEKTLREKVKSIISDSQKLSSFEKLSSKVPAITEATKVASINFISKLLSDLKNSTSDIEPKDLIENATAATKTIVNFVKSILVFVDIDDIGSDAEAALKFIKEMDHHRVREALESFFKMLPPVEKIIAEIDRNDNVLFKKLNKENLKEIVIKILESRSKIPEPIIDLGIDSFILAFKKIDPRKVRSLIELFVGESKIDSEVYSVLKAIALNMVNDNTKFLRDWNVTTANWDDLQQGIVKGIESIDGNLVNDLVHEALSDLKYLNVSVVADVVADTNVVIKDVLSDTTLQRGFQDPNSLKQLEFNKTIFTDFVLLFLDTIKVINETEFTRRCHNFTSLAPKDLGDKISQVTNYVKKQFERVPNGTEIAKKLKVDELSKLTLGFFNTVDLKTACYNGLALLKINKALSDESRKEAGEVLWKIAMKMKEKAVTPEGVDESYLFEVQKELQSLLKAMMESNGQISDEIRASRVIVRKVQGVETKNQFAWKHEITESEENEENEGFESREKILKDLWHKDDLLSVATIKSQKFQVNTPKTVIAVLKTTPVMEEEKSTTSKSFVDTSYPSRTIEVPAAVKQVVAQETVLTPKTEVAIPEKYLEEGKEIEDFSNSASECAKKSLELAAYIFSSEAKTDKLEAAKMLDASISVPLSWKDYSAKRRQCLAVRIPDNQFSAKYCSAKASITSIVPSRIGGIIENQKYGICIPSSCSAQEFNVVLKEVTHSFDSFLNLTVTPDSCQYEENEAKEWKTVLKAQMVILLMLMVLSTLYELRQRVFLANDKPRPLLCVFSLHSSGNELFCSNQSEEWHPAVDGIRVLGLAWMILHNSFAFTISSLQSNNSGSFSQFSSIFPMSLYGASDVLLLSAGLLMSRSFLRATKEKGGFDALAVIIKRYFRLAPSLAVMMIIRNRLLPNRNSDVKIMAEPPCGATWWHQMLFIQNFMNHDQLCLPQGWYLSLEMQLFLASPIVLYALFYTKKTRWLLSIALLAGFTALPFTLIVSSDSAAMFPSVESHQFRLDLVMPYTRAIPWIVGLLTGFFIYKQEDFECQPKFSTWLSAVVGALVLCVSCVWGSATLMRLSLNIWETALFHVLSRLGLSLGLATVIYTCAAGYGGWVNAVLSAGLFKVLGKLSYCAFLMHAAVINLRLYHSTSIHMDDYILLILFIGDFVMSFTLGLALYLLVEQPTTNLKRIIFGRLRIMPLPKTKRSHLIKT